MCVKLLYVKLLYVKFVCVKLLHVKFEEEEAGGGGGGADPGYRIKNKNPTQSCGEKSSSSLYKAAERILSESQTVCFVSALQSNKHIIIGTAHGSICII